MLQEYPDILTPPGSYGDFGGWEEFILQAVERWDYPSETHWE